MGNTPDNFDKPVYDDAFDLPSDLQDAVDFAKKFAFIRSGTAADRTGLASAKTPNGMLFTETDTRCIYHRTGGAWVLIFQDWTTYTPSTTNITATVTASYMRVGRMVHVQVRAVLTAAMTSQPTFTLPLTASDSNVQYLEGGVFLRDASPAAEYPGIVRKGSDTIVAPYCMSASGSFALIANVGLSNFPFTWASGDTIEMLFSYRAA